MKVAVGATVLLGALTLALAAYEIGRRAGTRVDAREQQLQSLPPLGSAKPLTLTEAEAARQREATLRLQIQRLEQRLDALDAARDGGGPEPKASEAADHSARPAAQTPA